MKKSTAPHGGARLPITKRARPKAVVHGHATRYDTPPKQRTGRRISPERVKLYEAVAALQVGEQMPATLDANGTDAEAMRAYRSLAASTRTYLRKHRRVIRGPQPELRTSYNPETRTITFFIVKGRAK